MLGTLYDQALFGERCWIRNDDGRVRRLPVHKWLGGRGADEAFDNRVVELCDGPTLELGCGPGRLIAHLVRKGVPALGVDQSATAISLARRSGAPALHRDVFATLPATGRWRTVLLVDGNLGLGGDPRRVLARARELMHDTGRCLAEFDPATTGVRSGWVRLESAGVVGPWFRWASVGLDCAARLAEEIGMSVAAVNRVGDRVLASLRPQS